MRTPAPWSRAVGLAVTLTVLLLAAQPLHGFDTWWHLASGREMVRTGRLLFSDPFSFTANGSPWIDHEWLWQLAGYELFHIVGGDGRSTDSELRGREEERGASVLTLVNGVLLSAAFALGYAALRARGTSLLPASALTLLCAWGARGRFLARPEAATLLLAACLLFTLDRERRTGRGSSILAIPLLVALGVNLHAGALVLPLLATLTVAADRLGSRPRIARGPFWAALLVAASFAATGANPAGYGLWSLPATLSEVTRSGSHFNPEWLPPLPSTAPLFFIALAGLPALLLLGILRGGRSAVDWPALLPQAALAALALTGIRHVGLFFVCLPFALAAPACAFLGERVAPPARRRAEAAAATALCLAVFAWLVAGREVSLGVDRSTTPVDACDFIARFQPQGRLYNDVRFGGYLIWRFGPERPVFIDGRNELYRPLLAELDGIYSGASGYDAWRALTDRTGIAGALVRYSEERKGVIYPATATSPPRLGYRAYSAYLFPREDWAIVYWDDTSMLFLRRGGANEGLIARFAYPTVNPEDSDHLLEKARDDGAFRESLRRDLERRIRERPASERARSLLSQLPDSRTPPRAGRGLGERRHEV